MLNPNNRSLLTDALTPPAGTTFESGIATTYSLDPEALLALPLHLALLAFDEELNPKKQMVELLEAIQRATSKLAIFYEHGRILPPEGNKLFGLLEPMLHPVKVKEGTFHPKILLLNFSPIDSDEPKTIRLLVMSRNLTFDNSWDVSVRLDGKVTKKKNDKNQPIVDLLETLPNSKSKFYKQLKKDVMHCEWELPDGFKSYKFHAILPNNKGWALQKSEKLAVISPFISKKALNKLHESTDAFEFLLSRQEELDTLKGTKLPEQTYVLTDRTDNSEYNDPRAELRGLHAKVYALEEGSKMHLLLGSANATSPVFESGKNTEFMVELIGSTRRVGGIKEFVSSFGKTEGFLDKYERSQESKSESNDEKKLEEARQALRALELKLICEAVDNGWRVTLKSESDQSASVNDKLFNDVKASFWLLSFDNKNSTLYEISKLEEGIVLASNISAAEITSLVGIKMCLNKTRLHFGLEATLEGAPEKREDAILRSIITDNKSFMRYLYILLAESGDAAWLQQLAKSGRSSTTQNNNQMKFEMPLFEQLARTFATVPTRLHTISNLIKKLDGEHGNDVIPSEFKKVWEVFEGALKGLKGKHK